MLIFIVAFEAEVVHSCYFLFHFFQKSESVNYFNIIESSYRCFRSYSLSSSKSP